MILTRGVDLGWTSSIPVYWKVVPLRYVAQIGTGHTPDRNKPQYWENCAIPWVTTPDVTKRADGLAPLMETEQHISELGLANSAAVLHPADTVMLSRTASVGYSVRIGKPMATTQAFVTWKPGPELDARYLLLVFRAMVEEWKRLAYGSTHLTIYMPDLEALRIPLPPLDEQRRIADFLDVETGRIDAVAAVRRVQVGLLDERSRSIVELHLSEATNTTQKLIRALALLRDGSHQPPPRVDAGVPLLTARNLSTGKLRLTALDTHVSDEDAVTMERSFRVTEGDVLMSVKGTIGAVAEVPRGFPRVVLDRNVAILRPQPELMTSAWLAFALASASVQEQIRAAVSTVAQPGLPLGLIASLNVPTASLCEQESVAHRIAAELGAIDNLKEVAKTQIEVLAERRQALITAAVTGQFDVTTGRGADLS